MKTKTITKIVAIACAAFLGTSAQALTINDPGVVGVHHGNLADSSTATETAAAQTLLNMLASTTIGSFQTSDTEYAGAPSVILAEGTQVNFGEADPVPGTSGWDYVLGKYDAGNAGYVLWHVGGAAFTPEEFSNPLWANKAGNGHRISHYTVFNATTIPDGGTTLLLLGAGLAVLGVARRIRKA